MTDSTLLSPKALAEFLDVPIGTVYAWNYSRSGPPAIKVGRHCRYRTSDVEAWLDANTKERSVAS